MKNFFAAVLALLFIIPLKAQNVGIGISNPPELLSINGTTLIDASNENNGSFLSGKVLKFGTLGNSGIGSNKQSTPSRYGLDFFTKGLTRLSIDTNGNVGISSDPLAAFKLTLNGNGYAGALALGTTTPDFFNYRLDINGNARTRLDQYVNLDLWVDRNFDVDGNSNLGGNLLLFGNLNAQSDATISGNVAVAGNITTDNGKGLVRSASATQQVISYPVGSVSFGNAGAGFTTDVTFAFSNVFAAAPRISLAQITTASGNFERWMYTIHSIDLATRTFLVRFYTPNGTGGATAMTLNFIAVGAAL
jgi:hypothetical protein